LASQRDGSERTLRKVDGDTARLDLFQEDRRQSGSYLSVPSSLMAIGLDTRRPAKEDFMSFSVLHEIGSEVIPGQLPVTPASQAEVGA